MYIDLIIIIGILILSIFFFRRFSSFVYTVCLMDIFLRLLRFLIINLKMNMNSFLYKMPDTFGGFFTRYMAPPLSNIFIWLIFICYCLFLYYSFLYLIGSKRRR